MADLNVRRDSEPAPEEDYSTGELVYWIVGILSIPLVPILLAWLFTPWTGM